MTLGISANCNTKDSLIRLVQNKTKEDTNQIKTIKALVYYYFLEELNIELALKYSEEGIKMAKKIKSNYWLGKMTEVLGYLKQNYLSDFEGAVNCYFLALRYYDKEKKLKDKFAVNLNLGNIFYLLNQYVDAEKYFNQALEIAVKLKMDDDKALVQVNLGSLYDITKRYDLALISYREARKYFNKINGEIDLARIDFNTMNISLSGEGNKIAKSTRLKAIEVFLRVIEVFKKYDDQNSIMKALTSIGIQNTLLGNHIEGEKNLLEAEKAAQRLKDYNMLLNIFSWLAKNANVRGEFKNEALYLKNQLHTSELLFAENKTKAMTEVQIRYQTDKIEAHNDLLLKKSQINKLEISKKNSEIAQSKTVRFALIGGLSLIIVFTLFLFNRFKITNRQKKTIELQKIIVEEKQRAIIDSINYARRIQQALLPNKKYVEKNIDRLKRKNS